MENLSTVPVVRSARASITETVHRGAAAVVDSDGHLVARVGDADAVYFLRSSAKPLQAVAAAEVGAFDEFDFTEAQIALTTASHSGEVAHVVEIQAMLAKLGLGEEHLICDPVYPLFAGRRDEMIRAGEQPTRLHNNCSGKHAAMLAAALACGEDTTVYWRPDHPHQQRIRDLLAALGEVAATDIGMGVDGCGVPCHAMPLRSAALAYARLANPAKLDDRRREACGRIAQAMVRYPYLIGGSERFDTAMLAVGEGRWANKGGAMGYFAAGISAEGKNAPGLGIALKIEDGSHQAASQMAVSIFDQLGLLDERRRERLAAWMQIPIKSSMHQTAGYSRPEFMMETDV